MQGGDILFQTSLSSQSRAIQLATRSPYSHVGILFYVKGKPMVLEAVQPVRLYPLDRWIKKGAEGKWVAKRLKNRRLTPDEVKKLYRRGVSLLHLPYDPYFEWSDTRLYCSELVWKLYNHLGITLSPLRTIGQFDLSHPLVRQKMRERYGDHIPMDEPVVAPSDLFASPLLETVKTAR